MGLKIKQPLLDYNERTGEKLTQKDLAKYADCSEMTIVRLMKKPNKTISTIKKLADKLGCKVDDLIG